MTKVLFFTAGALATSGELAAIAAITALNMEPIEVGIRNPDANPNYGAGPEETDFVAGTVPDLYTEVPVFDPGDFGPTLTATQAIVSNGQVIAVAGGNATITVVNNVVTNIVIAGGV